MRKNISEEAIIEFMSIPEIAALNSDIMISDGEYDALDNDGKKAYLNVPKTGSYVMKSVSAIKAPSKARPFKMIII
jgi:hypothetical protein